MQTVLIASSIAVPNLYTQNIMTLVKMYITVWSNYVFPPPGLKKLTI